jgi:hypothetical protein
VASKTETVQRYLDAQRSRDAAKIDAVAATLADDVTLNSPRGAISGKQAVLERLKNPPQGPGGGGGGQMMGQLTFAAPVEDGSAVKVTANIPAQAAAFIKGMAFVFNFNDAQLIQKIDVQIER